MKFAAYQVPAPAPGREAEMLAAQPGTSWARFGQEIVVISDQAGGSDTVPFAGRAAPTLAREEEVSREQLHVIVQNGRTFQQEHPEIPILYDRGRFLLAKLDPDKARQIKDEAETCYGVMPLEENQVIFDARAPAAARAAVPFIQALVEQASSDKFEANLTKLVSFATRHSTSSAYIEAATWAREQLDAMNYQTRSQNVTVNGRPSQNIIADKEGAGTGEREVVVVTAHLDSINLQGGPSAPAPGADDNGSGSAGVLEIARVFQDHRGEHDLRFILFGGEEEGLFGSKQYVASLAAAERAKIRAVVNMDMIGSLNRATQSVLIEGAPLSQTTIDNLSQAASTYTALAVETSLNPFASDHVPFIAAQIPAVLTIEGADNANENVHSANDTLDKVDPEFALEILRMNIGFVAGEIGQLP